MRRPQPSHAAALLVDQHRCIVSPDAITQRGNQLAELVGRSAIAPEQNEANRIGGAEEVAFERVQALTGAA